MAQSNLSYGSTANDGTGEGLRDSMIKIQANFDEIYDTPRLGIYDYADLTTATTPISLSASTWTHLTNDGAGSFTNKTYALTGITDIYNTSTSQFDFSSLTLGDTVDIRINIIATTSTSNQDFDIDLVLAYGDASEYRVPWVIEHNFKSAGDHSIVRFNSVYIGNTLTRDNPARFEIRSSNTSDIEVVGWYCRVLKRLL